MTADVCVLKKYIKELMHELTARLVMKYNVYKCDFGDVRPKEAVRKDVIVRNVTDNGYSITNVTCKSSRVKATSERDYIPQFADLKVEVELDARGLRGPFFERLDFKTTSPCQPTFSVEIAANVISHSDGNVADMEIIGAEADLMAERKERK